jgi:hypothetical protein
MPAPDVPVTSISFVGSGIITMVLFYHEFRRLQIILNKRA